MKYGYTGTGRNYTKWREFWNQAQFGVRHCIFVMSEVSTSKAEKIAIKGTVTFSNHYGSALDTWHETVTNPTYLDLWRLADRMIIATDDLHHVFLENFHKNPETGKYWFSMGS